MVHTATKKRTFSPHFMSKSMGADYGTFDCDKCHNEFYHSPSTIYLGEVLEYEHICGHCCNALIYPDHGVEPFDD